jgi:uncharacterized damage-inducible protein DinB
MSGSRSRPILALRRQSDRAVHDLGEKVAIALTGIGEFFRTYAPVVEDYLGVRRGERETLGGFLDWYRAVVERKVDGLTLEDAKRVRTPTGMSALGILKHLGWVERGWFRETFAGEDVEAIDLEGDNSAEFAIGTDDTVESVIAFYRAEVEEARHIVRDSPSLDALSARETSYGERVSLRWILVHMLEETARHGGHLDLMREEIDGQVGD